MKNASIPEDIQQKLCLYNYRYYVIWSEREDEYHCLNGLIQIFGEYFKGRSRHLLKDTENETNSVDLPCNVFEGKTLTSETRFQILNTVPWLHTISKNQPPSSRPIIRQDGDMKRVPGICAPLCNTNPHNISRRRMRYVRLWITAQRLGFAISLWLKA